MKKIFILNFLIINIFIFAFSYVEDTGMFNINIYQKKHYQGNVARNYYIYIPSDYDGITYFPLYILLHNKGGAAKTITAVGDWINKAEKYNFILLIPEALTQNKNLPPSYLKNPRIWNFENESNIKSDFKFLKSIINKAESTYLIDKEEVFLCGFGMGADFGYELILKYPLLINKAAFVGAEIEKINLKKITLPAILVNCNHPVNEKDNVVLYKWGKKILINRFELKHQAINIDNIGKVWPGGKNYVPEYISGSNIDNFDATEKIIEFMKNIE
ncbi:MAG: hypothetical protein ACQESP_09390 [Candidatus Muiribacteriota bacterium]